MHSVIGHDDFVVENGTFAEFGVIFHIHQEVQTELKPCSDGNPSHNGVISAHLDASSRDGSLINLALNTVLFNHLKGELPLEGSVLQILSIEIIEKLDDLSVIGVVELSHGLTWCLFEFFVLHTSLILEHLLLEFVEVNEPEKDIDCLRINFLIRLQFFFESTIKCLDLLIFKVHLELGFDDLLHNHDIVFVDVGVTQLVLLGIFKSTLVFLEELEGGFLEFCLGRQFDNSSENRFVFG